MVKEYLKIAFNFFCYDTNPALVTNDYTMKLANRHINTFTNFYFHFFAREIKSNQPPDLGPVALAQPDGMSFMPAKRALTWLIRD